MNPLGKWRIQRNQLSFSNVLFSQGQVFSQFFPVETGVLQWKVRFLPKEKHQRS